ncbi:SAP domain-containing protein [Mycena chlorophos]|uniref:ATP-dependent DNA helicase II subunit 1 n=1 Tax=Mycena chlorophos TaxID=658473 RepID=A0A8H6S7C6_MYCCL|nr:SAP domain-containing protein [Mycena chlorophos]
MGYDDWNRVDDEEEDELQDSSYYESKKDVILFCIDCSESMLELREDPVYENAKTCHAYAALEAAMQIEKRKVIVGPSDSIGILLFNTTRRPEGARGVGYEIKRGCFLYQPISPLSAPKIQELIHLLDGFREDNDALKTNFPPMLDGKRVPMGDVFTSCNWVLRDGAPKTATKRVFLITDEDNPHTGVGAKQLANSARTTLIDLTQSGVMVSPFFISSKEKTFDMSKFYASVLLPNSLVEDEEADPLNPSLLQESISVGRMEDLISEMQFREFPKRAAFSIPFQLAEGYGLVTEQKKGQYKYFADLGDRMEVVTVKTAYADDKQDAEVEKARIVYGLGGGTGDDDGQREVKPGQRPFYTAEEIRSFRTLELEPGIRLLGFKDRSELKFEDNVKHSLFIYPDELSYAGSKRTFSALLKSMLKKKKIALVLALVRRNSSPTFAYLLPQAESNAEGWSDPPGFHVILLPFADDIRSAPITQAARASEETKDAALAWITKLSVKNGAYPPDSYPNPALAFHNAQLQATAFGEEFDEDAFEDVTLPKVDMMHKRAGKLWETWKSAVANDENAAAVEPEYAEPKRGTKRKAETTTSEVTEEEIRSRHADDSLKKLTVNLLKSFLKSKGMSVSGNKGDLIERIEDYLSGGS